MSSNTFGGSGIIGRRIMRKVTRYADFSKWNTQVGQLLTSDLEELRQMSVSVPRIHAEHHKGGDDSVIGPGPPVQLVAGGAALVGDPTAGAQAEGHRHAAPVGTPVALGLAAAAGASGSFADGSHVHPATVTTNGDLLTVIAGVLARLALGAEGAVLKAGASALEWSAVVEIGSDAFGDNATVNGRFFVKASVVGGNGFVEVQSESGSAQWRFQATEVGGAFIFRDQASATNPLIIEKGAPSNALQIKADGKVGIGTSSPGSKLSVVGLPTSAAGLSAGDIWNDSGTLKIV